MSAERRQPRLNTIRAGGGNSAAIGTSMGYTSPPPSPLPRPDIDRLKADIDRLKADIDRLTNEDKADKDWLRSELDAARHKIKELAEMVRAERILTERLRSEVARLESDLRVERAITRHDAEVRALCDERALMKDLAVGMGEEER